MDEIKKLYQKRGYMDQYGIHVWITVLTCIAFLLTIGYLWSVNNLKSIKADWSNQKCNPLVMPFAGMINKSANESAMEYTEKNFKDCMNEILYPIAKISINPVKQALLVVANDILNTSKELINMSIDLNIRTEQAKQKQISSINELRNAVAPIYVFFKRFKSMFEQINGITYAIFYQLQGILYTIMSIIKSLLKFITDNAILKSKMCFAKGTPIKCFNETKPIEMIETGDVLWDGSEVTSTMCLTAKDVVLYELDNVLVTDNHSIFYPPDGWIQVADHPHARKVTLPYPHEHIYCFNTNSKTIKIGNYVFSDWDDLDDNDLAKLRRYFPFISFHNVHTIFERGYPPASLMRLSTGEHIQLKFIKPDMVLEHGEIVYGTVKSKDHCHLLTNKGTFYMNDNIVGDYNTLIEKYL